MCHGAQVQMKNVRLIPPEALRQHAQPAGISRQMILVVPLNNATAITEAERALIRRWFETGAATQ